VGNREKRRVRAGVAPGERAALVEKIQVTPSKHEFVRKVRVGDEFEVFKADPGSPGRVFEMLTRSDVEWPKAALSKVARELGWPKGAFVEWYTVEHAGLYEAALKIVAADLAVTAMEAALDADEDNVQAKKLIADTALRVAGRFDRARYGEGSVSRGAVVVVDVGLLGEAGKLLDRLLPAPERVEKVVDDAG